MRRDKIKEEEKKRDVTNFTTFCKLINRLARDDNEELIKRLASSETR